ncbi:MAG: DNA polymerase III subunit delta' [Chloroflexi bacterium]|nr:DNA polymerase III subunit delta' [Chloroflexota bacterium]
MSTWGIVGHKRAVSLLRRSVERGRISHAYLFSGASGIGKTTLAMTFAKVLLCASPDPPCNECRRCQSIAKGTHPDVRLLKVAAGSNEALGNETTAKTGKSRSIKIEQIRELQRDTALLPYEGQWKVYIIRNAEDMSIEAANCLLKTLEEPPRSVVLILTCADAKIVPATIVSRCQHVSLWPLGVEEVTAALRQRSGIAEADAKTLAHLSDGRIGWALNAAADSSIVGDRDDRLHKVVDVTGGSRTARFKYAEELAALFSRDPEAVYATLDLWLSWWRDLLLIKNGCHDMVTNLHMVTRLLEQAMKYTVEQLHGFMVEIESARSQLERNVNARLALEVMVLNVPQAYG